MCFRNSSRFVKGIVISLWTIVQTSFHIVFLLGGYYLCQMKPSHYLSIIFYITYFYNYDKCGTITLSSERYFSTKLERNVTRLIDIETQVTTEDYSIYDIVYIIAEKAVMPKESRYYFRTELYIFCYVIIDGCLLLSAFLLFAGICFHAKKCLSMIFYTPWLAATCISIILDVVSAVHFGLDMLHINNYTSWLKSVGVTNYFDFKKFNTHKSSSYIPHISSITMSVFFSKLLIFWILNIATFFTIATNFGIAYQGNEENNNNRINARRKSNSRVNFTESRIRHWQMFYGTVESNTSRSNDSIKASNLDQNTNNRTSRNSEENVRNLTGNSSTRYSLGSLNEGFSPLNRPTANSNYLKFPDVTEGVDTNKIYRRNSSNDSLSGQMPWSYLRFNERPTRILFGTGEGSNARNRNAFLSENTTAM